MIEDIFIFDYQLLTMNKHLLTLFLAAGSFAGIAQTQISNSDFEQWETVASDQEPTNWNSFLSAGGTWAWAAANQIVSSTDVRPGTAGTKSCLINSRDAFGIVANGNVTLGKINMGSTTPSSTSNYNQSVTSDANFSEAITDTPDSIVFWAKFVPNGHTENARMKATLHDAYDYKDPEDATSTSHVVATAELNYPSTNNAWVRFSVPFNYNGAASTVEYILVTFTTNESPGGGAANDLVYIDDVELIYNPQTSGLVELSKEEVFFNTESNTVNFGSIKGAYTIYNVSGAVVQSGEISESVLFENTSGVYFVEYINKGEIRRIKFYKD